MKSLRDAIQLRAEIMKHLEEANSKCNLVNRRSELTFVVAGAASPVRVRASARCHEVWELA